MKIKALMKTKALRAEAIKFRVLHVRAGKSAKGALRKEPATKDLQSRLRRHSLCRRARLRYVS